MMPGMRALLRRLGVGRLARLILSRLPLVSTRCLYLGQGRYFHVTRRAVLTPRPNLLVIGAMKSGTTSLHHYLKLHPDVFMSSPAKEPCYYFLPGCSHDLWSGRDLVRLPQDEYLKRYMLRGYRGQRWFGESSTYYTTGNLSRTSHIPERIHQAEPDTRLIYILRHPMERIVSEFFNQRMFWRRRPHVDAPISDLNDYVETSRFVLLNSLYAYQLRPYLRLFPRDQLLVLLLDELREEPLRTLNRVFEFLGLAQLQRTPPLEPQNTSAEERLRTPPEKLLLWPGFQDSFRRVIRKDLRALRPIVGPAIDRWEV